MAYVAQSVERWSKKTEVAGSNPGVSENLSALPILLLFLFKEITPAKYFDYFLKKFEELPLAPPPAGINNSRRMHMKY